VDSINLIFVFLFLSFAWSSGFSSDKTIAKEIEDKAEYISANVHPVFNVSCSMEGKYYAGANATKTITIRETESGKVVRKLQRSSKIRAVEFNPSSELVVLGLISGTIEVWDIGTGKLLKNFRSLGGPISDMEYSRDGKYFVVAGGMGNTKSIGVKIYDAKTLEELHFINDAAPYEAISIDENSKNFAVSTWHGISIYELHSGKQIYEYAPGGSYFDLSLSNNAETLTFSENLSKNKSFAVVLDLKSNRVVLSLLSDVGVNGAILSNDGSMMFVAGQDSVVGIFDMESKEWLNHATPNGGSIHSMRLCGNKHLITGHWHNAVNIINIFTGNLLRSHPGG
jgi:WD40 repeat protein